MADAGAGGWGQSSRYLLLFAAGTAVGSAIALGAAYGFSSALAAARAEGGDAGASRREGRSARHGTHKQGDRSSHEGYGRPSKGASHGRDRPHGRHERALHVSTNANTASELDDPVVHLNGSTFAAGLRSEDLLLPGDSSSVPDSRHTSFTRAPAAQGSSKPVFEPPATPAAQRSHQMSASAVAGVLAEQHHRTSSPGPPPLAAAAVASEAASASPVWVTTAPLCTPGGGGGGGGGSAQHPHSPVRARNTGGVSGSVEQRVSPFQLAVAAELGAMSSAAPLVVDKAAEAAVKKSVGYEAISLDHTESFARVITPEMPMNEETEGVCAMIHEMMEMRTKWLFKCAVGPEQRRHEPEAAVPSELQPAPLEYRPLPPSPHTYTMVDGVFEVYMHEGGNTYVVKPPGTATEFFSDMHRILRYAALGPVKSFTHHRLMLLEQKFNLHVMLNADKEFLAQKLAPHRDFYNVRKVDTHIHHSACMHQKHLLRFIKSKLRKEPDEVVIFRDGKYLTLREVFESLNLTGHDLNVDTLDMHADKSLFHRFDKFNLKYNPCGQSRLREIFIKQDNIIHGRFLAELTKEVFDDLEASKYQHAELRISIYGRKAMEWDILASWVVANSVYSDNNVWLIQIPRLYNVYKETGVIDNFEQMLRNIFEPLFEVTQDPSSHPQLHVLLGQVVGFDMVDDESKPERRPTKHSPTPLQWSSKHNCAYSYYAYYVAANLHVLNKFREARGLNTFAFRPHAGEAGDIDHLASAFLLCDNIAHGINLRKSPCLQYLFYLAQIGLCMSPLSNNSLFLDYHRNPMPTLFARGLSVSLSTDDPLQIHLTKEPLVEEYSVAAQVWKLSSTDLCEIARSGVLHSGFPHACKKHWVATEYWRSGPEGNDIQKTNVPDLRLRFRHETHMAELSLLTHGVLTHQARLAAMGQSV